MSKNVVSVRGLVKAYGGRKVVDALDLDVASGQIVGLIGANGAGKTTTVECIQGLRHPDAGQISVLGLNPLSDRDRLRGLVGSQLQSAGLPDRLRVGEALWLFGGSGQEGLLERFGLADRRRSAFGSLSGGERQRLFLVLALLNQPRLVILDELTQGLDPAARRGVWEAIDELRGAGTAVLLVTHELEEAEALCDRVVVMRSGQVLDTGTPAELVDRHGRSVAITFTMPESLPALMLEHLPSVARVEVVDGKATVSGNRAAIAEVGAALVRSGTIPYDLSVRVPRLEDALVDLLEGPMDGEPGDNRSTSNHTSNDLGHNLIGALR